MKRPPQTSRRSGRLPQGPPSAGEARPLLKNRSFKADPETEVALKQLMAELPPGTKGKVSTAIRRALLEAVRVPSSLQGAVN